MTDNDTLKRSPTTPSTPSLRAGANSKKFKRHNEESPTKIRQRRESPAEDVTRKYLIMKMEQQRMQETIEFLELERAFNK